MWADNSASVVALVVPHMNLILGFFQRGCLGGGGGSGGVKESQTTPRIDTPLLFRRKSKRTYVFSIFRTVNISYF